MEITPLVLLFIKSIKLSFFWKNIKKYILHTKVTIQASASLDIRRKQNAVNFNELYVYWNGKVATVVWVVCFPLFFLGLLTLVCLIKKGSDWISFVDPLYQSSGTELLLFVSGKHFHLSLLLLKYSRFQSFLV